MALMRIRRLLILLRNICRQVEAKTGIVYNDNKIYDVGYDIKKIVFDGVSAKEALEQLSRVCNRFCLWR